MKTNIITINTIMKNMVKYICAVLLLIGTSARVWATDCTYYVWDSSANKWAEYVVQDENATVVEGPVASNGKTFIGWHVWNPDDYPNWKTTSSGYIQTSGAAYYTSGGESATVYVRYIPDTQGNTAVKNTGKSDSDHKLYAIYSSSATDWSKAAGWSASSEDKVTITFNKNDANASGTMATQTVLKNTTTYLQICEFIAPTDKVFGGWATSPSGSITYSDQGTISISSNTTLYAIWIDECTDISSEEVNISTVTPVWNCSTNEWDATVTWDAVPSATRYFVQLGYWNGSAWKVAVATSTIDAPTRTKTYTNLTTGTKYKAIVAAQNQCSESEEYHTSTYESNEFTPTCPTVTASGSATSITQTSAVINWGSTGAAGCYNTYEVVVEKHSDGSDVWYTSEPTTSTSHSLTGLVDGTQYDVTVSANNACGESDVYGFSFTTTKNYINYVYTCIDINLATTDGTGNPLIITSAAGQKIKAVRTLTLSVDGETGIGTKDVTLSGPDLLFYKSDGTLITGSVLQTSSGDLAETTIYVAYAPSAYAGEVIATPTITVSCDGNNVPFPNLVTARCLPDNFVIAAKLGNMWYALPANITSSSSNTSGIPIQVDNVADPSSATGPEAVLKYGLRNVQVGTAKDRYVAHGSNLVFTERLTTTTADNQKTLYNGSKTSIQVNAMYSGYATTNPERYEWISTTSDLKDYTLTSAATLTGGEAEVGETTRTISLNNSGVWGTLMQDKAYDGKVRLLPLTNLTDMQVEVMEWGTSSMALRFGGDVPSSVDITLGANSWTNKALTNITSGGTSDLYSVSGLTLTGDNCTLMTIKDHDNPSNGVLINKPILVNNTSATSSAYKDALSDVVCEGCDIVILNGGKLTANQTKTAHTTFANIYVYPGGKLILDGNSLGAKNKVYVRGGHSWLNTSEYALPDLYINGDINFNGSGNIIYDYYIQNYQYYQFCLPYTVPLANVTDEAGVDNFPVWVKYYNGALRAADASKSSWDWYGDKEGQENFNAGIGYIIAARPRQVGNVANRPLSIIRFPLGNSAFNSGYGEEGKPATSREVTTTAHGISGYEAGTVSANNVGWNFVGNPYMATWKAPAGGIGGRQLTKDETSGTWNGKYIWVDAATKYVTIMSPTDGTDYEQSPSANMEFQPFFPFYMQETASGGNGTLTFTVSSRQKKAPAYVRTDDEPREAFVQINLEGDGSKDQTGLYVSDKYKDELDFDDFEKMFGSSTAKPKVWLMHDEKRMAFESVKEARAAEATPLGYRAPKADTYVLIIDEDASKVEEVKAVYLNDNVAGVMNHDLMLDAYEFESQQFAFNDERFTIRIVLKDENEGTTTGIDALDINSDVPTKFIYQDKMYILYHGIIYDAVGKKVSEINK